MPASRPLRRALTGLALAALLVAAVTGCSGSDEPATPSGSATTTAPVDPGEVPTDPPTAGPVGVFGDLQSLPSDFPADIPLVAGELRLADPMDGGGFTVLINTGLPDNQAAVDGAVDLLTSAGWVTDAATTTATLSVLTKAGRSITLGVFQDDDQATLNYLIRDAAAG